MGSFPSGTASLFIMMEKMKSKSIASASTLYKTRLFTIDPNFALENVIIDGIVWGGVRFPTLVRVWNRVGVEVHRELSDVFN